MRPLRLNLRFSVFAPLRARRSTLLVYGHIRPGRQGLRRQPPEFLVLCRDESGRPPASISKSRLGDEEIVELAKLLHAGGFPWGAPRAMAREGSPAAEEKCATIQVRLWGQSACWDFGQGGTIVRGGGSKPMWALWDRLGALADVCGRPAARAIIDGFVLDRLPARREDRK
jgi:hypothetical protein